MRKNRDPVEAEIAALGITREYVIDQLVMLAKQPGGGEARQELVKILGLGPELRIVDTRLRPRPWSE